MQKYKQGYCSDRKSHLGQMKNSHLFYQQLIVFGNIIVIFKDKAGLWLGIHVGVRYGKKCSSLKKELMA